MKKFKVVQALEENSEVIDLIEIGGSKHYMANPDDFTVGDEVDEDEFVVQEVNYVDDQGVGTGLMAFRTLPNNNWGVDGI